MKQHITTEQFNKLSKRGKEELWKWLGDNNYAWKGGRTEWKFICDGDCDYPECQFSDPLLSIGQMIEFLDENKIETERENYWGVACVEDHYWYVGEDGGDELSNMGEFESKELCDALWFAVKEILEK